MSLNPSTHRKLLGVADIVPVITNLEADGLGVTGTFVTSVPKEAHGLPENHTQGCPLTSAYLA